MPPIGSASSAPPRVQSPQPDEQKPQQATTGGKPGLNAGCFNDDIAFREGVLSMVWLAQNRPADFDTRRQLQTSSQASTAVVRG